jgi:hypothetical protein
VYGPSFPGQRLAQQVAYWFDEVFVLRTETDAEGVTHRYLQTASDIQYTAKDRSGALDLYEAPDLAAIAAKIRQPRIRVAA